MPSSATAAQSQASNLTDAPPVARAVGAPNRSRPAPAIVKGAGAVSNGVDRAPAIITRVWSDGDTKDGPVLINLHVLPDLADARLLGSVRLYDSEAHCEEGDNNAQAFWPERT